MTANSARMIVSSRDVRPLLAQIGALLVARAQRSFDDQALGSVQWPARYPSQSEPFINVAGALADLSAGGKIKDRRFDRRPAGIDTGALRQSISWQIVGERTLSVGSALPYADRFQQGGVSSQPVTQTARDALTAERTKNKKKQEREAGIGRGANVQHGPSNADRRELALKKLGFLYAVDKLDTTMVARPFLGATPGDEANIATLTREFFARPG